MRLGTTLIALVTGGLGFIGSHLCEQLVKREVSIRCFDNLWRGKLHNLEITKRLSGRIEFIKGDLLNTEDTLKAAKDADIIYHLGAVVGVKHYVEDPLKVIDVNVLGTHNILEAARRNDVERFILGSTSEIYGKNVKVPLSEDDDRILGPTSIDRWCYSTSKALDEHICLGYQHKYGMKTTILRYFNVYGPKQDCSDYGGVVSIFVRRVLNGEAPQIHGDGKQTRAFAYVDDIVEGTILAGQKRAAIGGIFNLGSSEETSIIELAHLAIRLADKEGQMEPIFIPHEDFYGFSYEDIKRRVPDTSRALHHLGYRTNVELREGLKRTLDWYRGNPGSLDY